MRRDAEVLLRSAIADTAAYLKVILIDSNAEIEVIRALAYATRIADSIAAAADDDLAGPELAGLRGAAARLNGAVAELRPSDFKSWIEETAREILDFCRR